ncbi:MAG TPA: maleylpyruvate isomerase family mycothiol-dependent enzyme [Mycobacteriales bacterium]|nr:maleylpyruvate isomerase family mycothiol-dependent enzyme [Mycobacteriales bacterium]
MASLADRTIAALRAHHDELAGLIPILTDAQLTGPSGASEWSVAQVLSHLGSGAEIGLVAYQIALTDRAEPEADFNQGVWDRWNAMSPQDQANGFLEHDARLLETIESLTPDQRANLQIKLSFLPAPLGIATIAGMRLNEVAHHSWDVRVGLDPAATLHEEAAAVLLEQLSGELGFMLRFTGKADALASPAVVDALGYGLVIADEVSLAPSSESANATFAGPTEALVRLFGGRLKPAHTPEAVEVTGDVSLDDLRSVFPGF